MAANFSLEPSVDDVSPFFIAHSELYREQIDGDPAATVQDCLPPEVDMPRKLVLKCLAVMSRVSEECAAQLLETRRRRILLVRDSPLHASLAGFDNDEWLTNLKKTSKYTLLPRLLVDTLELESAVVEARRQYLKAVGSYNLVTATSRKPRLADFLLKSEKLQELLRGALEDYQMFAPGCCFDDDITPGDSEYRATGNIDYVLRRAIMDGMMGESFREYGYTPSIFRALAYTTGCVLAGREIPFAIIPQPGVAQQASTRVDITNWMRGAVNPLWACASMDNVAALQQFHRNGWDLKKDFRDLCNFALASDRREAFAWLASLFPDAFDKRRLQFFGTAIRRGLFDTARWIVQGLDVRSMRKPLGWREFTESAAKHNDLDALKWLHLELGFPLSKTIAKHACKNGNKQMLDWYLAKAAAVGAGGGVGWRWHAFEAGVAAGHLDLSLSLLKNGRPGGALTVSWLSSACEAFKGDTAVLDALISIEPPLPSFPEIRFCLEKLASEAACYGYVHVLEWITKQSGMSGAFQDPNTYLFLEALDGAVKGARTDCVRWLLDRATKEKLDLMAHGSLGKPRLIAFESDYPSMKLFPTPEMLELLAPYFDLACFYRAALRAADVDALRRLKEMGYSFEACAGHSLDFIRHWKLDEVRIAEKKVVKVTEQETKEEGEGQGDEEDDVSQDGREEEDDDHREHQLPWHSEYRDSEAVRCLDYFPQDSEKGATEGFILLRLLQFDSDPHPKWLRMLRCLTDECGFNFATFSYSCRAAARGGSVEMMQFVLEHGGTLSTEVLGEAGRSGHLPLCRWLRQQGVEWPEEFSKMARVMGADEVAAWAEEEQTREMIAALTKGGAGGAGAGGAIAIK